MTQSYKKKLIEVAIPLEAINEAAMKEKSNPFLKGHPRSLHQWWARRPLPTCRAILFAQLVDDPSGYPEIYLTNEAIEQERKRLFEIIADLVKWENSTNESVLKRAMIEIEKSCDGDLPSVLDPFSGGGAIPLEAQRLGLTSYASDLNPVAVMISKSMIEFPKTYANCPPIHGGASDRMQYRGSEGLSEDIEFYGRKMKEIVHERIGSLFPKIDLPKIYGGAEAEVIAWVWARTVPSPDPSFKGAPTPLVTTFVLSSKKGKQACIAPLIDKDAGRVSYTINDRPNSAEMAIAALGTKSGRGANFKCLLSDAAITSEYVKDQANKGNIGNQLIAIVAAGNRKRYYLPPTASQEKVGLQSRPAIGAELSLPHHPQYVGVGGYGMKHFEDLFSNRQLITLQAFCDAHLEIRELIKQDATRAGLQKDASWAIDERAASDYANAISVYLAFAIDKLADYGNSLCGWNSTNENITHLFTRHALPMMWDFVEGNPFGPMLDFAKLCGSVASGLSTTGIGGSGLASQADASSITFPSKDIVISTDPPYYDNVPYADISDFFYVWLRKTMKDVFPELFSTVSVPKMDEMVADRVRHGGADAAESFFLERMTDALKGFVQQSSNRYPATIYYAFKQSEISDEGISSTGWAAFLDAVLRSGYAIVATWPVRTERTTRMRAIGSNALANSVVLVCRKREIEAEVVTRVEFIRALKRELPSAIRDLQIASVAPADMPQSAIGPGIGVFSRYLAVLESDDSPMSVKAALQLINRELDEYLGGIQGEFDADTRFAITWFEQNGLKAGDYGTANNIATARGISVESVKHAGIVESAAGKVRILNRSEMDVEWEPDTDGHLTVWECCQHLVRLHEKNGIGYATAVMLKKIGPKADDVRDLAYVLYNICEKRGEAKEATSYNALIADWTDLTREAAVAPMSNRSGQMRFEV